MSKKAGEESRTRAAIAGIAGIILAFGITELVHGLYQMVPSVLVSIAQGIVEFTPGSLVTRGIELLGTADIPVLIATVVNRHARDSRRPGDPRREAAGPCPRRRGRPRGYRHRRHVRRALHRARRHGYHRRRRPARRYSHRRTPPARGRSANRGTRGERRRCRGGGAGRSVLPRDEVQGGRTGPSPPPSDAAASSCSAAPQRWRGSWLPAWGAR